MQTFTFCAELNLTNAVSCKKGIETLLTLALPKSELAQMIDLSSWQKVLTTSRWQQGFQLLGLKIIGRLKAHTSAPGNIFDDIVESFQKLGLPKEEVLQATFKTLLVVANGAANTCARVMRLSRKNELNDFVETPASKTLCVLGSAINILDFQRSTSGQALYSLPNNIKASCYYPKPYHFWMAASLSYLLVNEYNISPIGASMAAFLSQKFYQ